MRRALAVLMAATIILGACATEPDVTAGTIASKDHGAARTVCKKTGTGTKKRTSCRVEPEKWELDLRDADGNTGEVKVSKETWERLQVGDYYTSN